VKRLYRGGLSPTVFARLLIPLASFVDRTIGWDRLPRPLGILTLVGLRDELRERNLTNSGLVEPAPPPPPDLSTRTLDGGWNDLGRPAMGSLGTRFGRNIPLDRAHAEPPSELLDPSPRVVAEKLLARDSFKPAESINVLAAAWIQFEVHDWLSHDTNAAKPITVPLAPSDPWPEPPMEIPSTIPDPNPADPDMPPVYATEDTHWWDASQIYGNDQTFQGLARTGINGHLALGNDGLQPTTLDPLLDPIGPRGNFWAGLAIFHALFIREHNAICDELLRHESRNWTDDELHDKARLINAAVMAKIHTVEWTSAIIAHPTTEWATKVNWYGLLGKRVRERVGRIGRGDLLSGIRGSPTDHYGVPYSMTEEFVSVYRMHPLIPDDYTFWPLGGGPSITASFPAIGPGEWRPSLQQIGVAEAFYSLGIANPGAIVLHNYPTSLRVNFRPDVDGPLVDLATVDVLRDRERGVPRYNEFRTLMHRKPVKSFEELTDSAGAAAELSEVYGHIDRVDLMVGLFAESRPKGFAFSDTAFRIFLLMASRRLKSDRFFSIDYTRDVYTETGLEWIDDTTLSKLLVRHYPELRSVMRWDNAFKPWFGTDG
jgi:Animal haem peroxidase